MSIASETADTLTAGEIDAIKALDGGQTPAGALAKRLKALGIFEPKNIKHPLTLYGGQVIRLLKEKGRWPS